MLKEIASVVGSPPLMLPSPDVFMSFPDLEEMFGNFQKDLEDLAWPPPLEEEVIGSQAIRLGNRFEKMLIWWLKRSNHYEVLASNVVIQGAHQTLGEMDLFVENKSTGQRTHLELACKFYLNTSHSSKWNQWVGTNPIDRLDLKIKKLEKQLDLRLHPRSAQFMQATGCICEASYAMMKGWFFYHFRGLKSPVRPLNSNPLAPSGWWCHYSEWKHIWSSQAHWILIQPQHWLRTRHEGQQVPLTSPYEWSMERQQLVAQVEWRDQEWVELNRGMIVYDGWPDEQQDRN